ncbi:MAG: hypothetical protein JWO06_2289 [Bacteroidota bacterium]|nr:hypothetical protein [Bacteroidota bacterium]
MDSALLTDTNKRLDFFRWLTGASIAITVLATWNLWSCDRGCPTAPLIGIHSYIFGIGGLVFKLLLIAFSFLFILKIKLSGWLLTGLILIGFADDFNRLLPNTYQFLIVVILFSLLQKGRESTLLSGLRIMQAGVYVWTGVLKLNSGFVNQASGFVFDTLHIQHPLPHSKYIVLVVAVWEIAIGISFLTGKKVRVAILSALILHLIISIILLVSGWNRAIISYNIFLILGNFILFSGTSIRLISDIEKPKAWIQKIAIALFIVLPALNLVHWWPDFMSSSLYSYRSLTAFIYIDDKLKQQLPDAARRAVFNSKQGQYISVTHWIQNETGTVPNPQKFVYDKMFKQLESKYNCSDSVTLYVY